MSYKQLWEIFGIHPRKVAQILKQNTESEKYPCYKVINSSREFGGYNQGVEKKIEKLENDGFIIENSKIIKHSQSDDIFWQWKFFNFFVAFPLEDKNFQKLAKELQKINNWSFTVQKPESPHITLKFFWEIDFTSFYKIIEKTKKLKIKPKKLIFDQVDNFGEKIWFYKTKNPDVLIYTYHKFHEITGLEKDKRAFKPHLTILRVKNPEKFNIIKNKVLKILNKYTFTLYPDKLRFYLAVDQHFQVPIVDISLI